MKAPENRQPDVGPRLRVIRQHEFRYSRSIRLAAITALVLLIFGFLFIRMPEARPYKPRTDPETITIKLPDRLLQPPEPPKPRVRPKLPIADPKGKDTDDGVGINDWDDGLFKPPYAVPDTLEGVEVWQVEREPDVIHIPVPEYPDMARIVGIEGRVVLKVLIDTSGGVAAVRVLGSSGNSLLDSAAVSAGWQSRFTPGYQGTMPVRVWVRIPFDFLLD